MTTHSALLHQVGDHDYDASVLLPHHPPEVLKRGLERTLRCDVRLGFIIALWMRNRSKHHTNTVNEVIMYRNPSGRCNADITHIYVVGVNVVTVFGVFASQRPEFHSTVVIWR